jgi:putative transposase
MTQPRCVLPGQTVMITRRCLRRTQLFRPDPKLNQLYLYCLAVMAQRHGIAVHAAVLMSNHEHLIVTDTRGALPNFLRELHRLVALGVKVLRKWEGAVWDHERPSVVELCTQQAIIEKLAYVMANPVHAGLVKRAKDWPGLRVLPDELGRECLRAHRPALYFDQNNESWPAQAELQLELPNLGDLTAGDFRAAVAAELREREDSAGHDSRAQERSRRDPRSVLNASPYKRAKSWEPVRGTNPTFAVGRAQKDAFFTAVAALRAFRRAYRLALAEWRRGVRSHCFPLGTWLMHTLHGAAMAGA